MLLSIIVPVYNTEAYLPACLGSICAQADVVADVEVWIIDDGSPDDSISVIREFQRMYPQLINVIRKENGGLSDTRNAGLERARGDFVWFVDSDDSVPDDCLKELLAVLRDTRADYLLFDALQVDDQGLVTGKFTTMRPADPIVRVPFTAENVQSYFSRHMVWMRLFRRSFIGDLRFPVGITHEDIHFDLQVLIREPLIEFVPSTWYRHFFDNPLSITNTMNPRKFREVLWVYQDLRARLAESLGGDRKFLEFLRIGVHDLLARSKYMLSLPAMAHERLTLFREYAAEIALFLDELTASDGVPPTTQAVDRLLLRLIFRRRVAAAYAATRACNAGKLVYDELGRRTHGLRHGFRKTESSRVV